MKSLTCPNLTRELMGSGELHVLMGGKGPLRIFKSKSRRVKIQTVLITNGTTNYKR